MARVIPNPLLRYAVVTAATALAPMVARRFSAKMQERKLDKLARADRADRLNRAERRLALR
jgi:hypothetical protein